MRGRSELLPAVADKVTWMGEDWATTTPINQVSIPAMMEVEVSMEVEAICTMVTAVAVEATTLVMAKSMYAKGGNERGPAHEGAVVIITVHRNIKLSLRTRTRWKPMSLLLIRQQGLNLI